MDSITNQLPNGSGSRQEVEATVRCKQCPLAERLAWMLLLRRQFHQNWPTFLQLKKNIKTALKGFLCGQVVFTVLPTDFSV